MPILIGEGIPFFGGLDKDVPLHLMEVKSVQDRDGRASPQGAEVETSQP
jgi:hypothetical protein